MLYTRDLTFACADPQTTLHVRINPGSTLLLGRHPSCDVVIPCKTVARRHAILYCTGTRVTIQDNSSPSGTFVNDSHRRWPTALGVGDRVRLGGCTLELLQNDASTPVSCAQLRKAYGSEEARCLVGGASLKPEQLTVRAMNFGQPWRTPGIKEVDYQLMLPARFVVDRIDDVLPEIKEEFLRDPDPDSLLERALGVRGWPSARDVLLVVQTGMMPIEVANVMLTWFAHNLLLEWLGDCGQPGGFIVNSSEGRLTQDYTCEFWGQARPFSRAAFQDE